MYPIEVTVNNIYSLFQLSVPPHPSVLLAARQRQVGLGFLKGKVISGTDSCSEFRLLTHFFHWCAHGVGEERESYDISSGQLQSLPVFFSSRPK